MTDDPYKFWRKQLAGEPVETTPGTPHAGYYINDWRESYPNPNPTVGGPRRKVRIIPGVCAIWLGDKGDWLCRTDSPEMVRLVIGREDCDAIFARVCRKAISFEEYTEKTHDYGKQRDAARAAADRAEAICSDDDFGQVFDGAGRV